MKLTTLASGVAGFAIMKKPPIEETQDELLRKHFKANVPSYRIRLDDKTLTIAAAVTVRGKLNNQWPGEFDK